MTSPVLIDEDARFFAQHPSREVRIRLPKQGEQNREFLSLGFHDPERRRIIAWKVPKGSAFGVGRILRIPFLQFADETIADTDEVLSPILHSIMLDAAKDHNIPLPRMGKHAR